MAFGVDPEALVGDPVHLVTALVEGRQVAQDICVGDPVNLATAQNDRDTAQVQQLIDQTPDIRITTNPTVWFPAVGRGKRIYLWVNCFGGAAAGYRIASRGSGELAAFAPAREQPWALSSQRLARSNRLTRSDQTAVAPRIGETPANAREH